MTSASGPLNAKELTQRALQANKDHQYNLKVYSERLEAELEAVDKLLAVAEIPEDELEVDAGGTILVPGSVKAEGLLESDLSLGDLIDEKFHQVKAAELETLAEAVRSENHRIYALEAQRRGQQPLVGINDHPEGFFGINKVGINWERVASKVSAAGTSYVQRTPQECEIRWLGDRHPEFNRSPWTEPENTRVKELVGDLGQGEVDWVDIAAKLGTGRTPVDCMRHAVSRRVHVWTPGGDKRLMDAIGLYGTGSWMLVARYVSEDATASQCQNRYTRTLDPSLRRGAWTKEEDSQLRRAVEVFGRSWVEVCTFVPTRSNEQCRDRWQEALNPGIGKGKWTDVEDITLLDAYDKLGNTKWKDISLMVGNGRTDNMCRHRFTLLNKRRGTSAAGSPSLTDSSVSTPVLEDNTPGPSRLNERYSGTGAELAVPIGQWAQTRTQRSAQKQRDTTTADTCHIPPPLHLSGDLTRVPESQSTQRPKPKPKPRQRVAKATAPPVPESGPVSHLVPGPPADGPSTTETQPNQVAEPTVKRPRGRPRKVQDKALDTVPSESTTTESAQAPAAQKRPRGRPRKVTRKEVSDPEDVQPPAKKRATRHTRQSNDTGDVEDDFASTATGLPMQVQGAMAHNLTLADAQAPGDILNVEVQPPVEQSKMPRKVGKRKGSPKVAAQSKKLRSDAQEFSHLQTSKRIPLPSSSSEKMNTRRVSTLEPTRRSARNQAKQSDVPAVEAATNPASSPGQQSDAPSAPSSLSNSP
ncbi:hypothetical protein PHLCEN_2v10755 [Hermanssonia centrifuga]|uniref:Uncharacterized protein n=1 Tax=Hermanssonia centrifuga TaxID=98765 RepID=A0A2R6NM54_9APHY|nr:hypothetical protein PHLCEN_2v10755 [Hermanssonia centrifuga]